MANILFLAHRIPYPPNKGDKIRSWNFLKRMAKDHTVHAGFFIDEPTDEKYVEEINQICESVCAVSVSKTVQKLMSVRGLVMGKSLTESAYPFGKLRRFAASLLESGEIDCVFLFSAATAPVVLQRCNVPIISDLVDVDSDKWDAYAKSAAGLKKWIFSREAKTLLDFEKQLIAASHAALFVSGDEAALMQKKAPALKEKIVGIANGVDTEAFDPKKYEVQRKGKRLIFTGAMDYAPNIEAVVWFTEKVWPVVAESCPNAEFVIAGAPVAPSVLQLAERHGITVTGFVDDMAAEIAAATVAVAPLQTARGIQNKVLEAMAMGLPVIATSLANEGINAEDKKHIFVADAPEVFAKAVIDLLSNSEDQAKIGEAARNFVSSNFSWDQKYQQLSHLLRNVLDD